MKDKLTDQKYWEAYYGHSKTNRKQIESICSQYDEFWNLLFKDRKVKTEKPELIEIGGHPGRYLAYLGNKYDVTPTCLDFNSDRIKIDESMASFNVIDYHVIQTDFFDHKNDKKYDYVISGGFIEHFENFNLALDLHVEYLKPGGRMLIMIPNKRFYKFLYQSVLDKENLKMHNLAPMRLSVFKKFAKSNNLNIEKLTYFSGFQFRVHYKVHGWKKIITDWHERIFKRLINPVVEKYPNRFFSSMIVCVLEKPL